MKGFLTTKLFSVHTELAIEISTILSTFRSASVRFLSELLIISGVNPITLSAFNIESRVAPFDPLSVIESAEEMLRGEMITFSDSGELYTTFLKMSSANEFSDSISETWLEVRLI